MAKIVDINLSSKIDVFHSFKRLFDPDIVLEFSMAIKEGCTKGSLLFSRKYKSISIAEEEFHFYLSRYFYDLTDILLVAKPMFRKRIKEIIGSDIKYMQSRVDESEIEKNIIEQNKFERAWFLERTGERRLSSSPRDREKLLSSSKMRSMITEDYKDFVRFHAETFMNRNTILLNSKKEQESTGSYFDFDIRSSISDWRRFILICKYFSDGNNFRDKKVDSPPILYNHDSNSFYWVGIGKSVVPSLAEFIRALNNNGILKPSKAKMRIPNSFIKYFGLWEEIQDKKYLMKQIKNCSSKTFIFKKISELN